MTEYCIIRKRKGKEGPRNVRKFGKNRKSKQEFFLLSKKTEEQIS